MKKINNALIILTLSILSLNAFADAYDVEERADSADYSRESDQPMRRDFDLRQIQKAFNESNPKENIKTFIYNPNQIYKVKLRLYMNTLLYLPEGEEISAYSLGDTESFEVQTFQDSIPNLINVRSGYAGTDTNLSIFSKSGRIYSFYLRTHPVYARVLPDFVVYIKEPKREQPFQFVGKEKEDLAKDDKNKKFDAVFELSDKSDKKQETVESKEFKTRLAMLKNLQKDNDYLKSIEDPFAINIDYKMYGDQQIAPFGVYDDGKWTYFDFRENFVSNRLPVIYKVIDKYDAVVNTRVENGFLIAESLSPEGWTLKNGDKSVCIKPKGDLLKTHAAKTNKKDGFFKSLFKKKEEKPALKQEIQVTPVKTTSVKK